MASSLTAGILKKYPLKPITAIISGVMFIVSNITIFYNIAVISVFAKAMYLPIMVAVFVFVVPSILLIISLIRNKHIKAEIEKINSEVEKEGIEDDFQLPKGEELFVKNEA